MISHCVLHACPPLPSHAVHSVVTEQNLSPHSVLQKRICILVISGDSSTLETRQQCSWFSFTLDYVQVSGSFLAAADHLLPVITHPDLS